MAGYLKLLFPSGQSGMPQSLRAFDKLPVKRSELLLAIVVVSIAVSLSIQILIGAYTLEADESALRTAAFLNTNTRPEALIETYDA
jgi:hypothetical protein